MPADAQKERQKKQLRQRARALRKQAHLEAGDEAANKLLDNFIAAMARMNFPPPGTAVAGYAAMGSEISAWPLLLHLHRQGYVCALPAKASPGAPLAFKAWRPGVPQDAPWGPEMGPEIIPQAALCPLLAFNRQGVRLGQGGGHYDRTLDALRQARPLLAVGLAFDVQLLEELPSEAHDQRLDWVVTEKAAYDCGALP